MSNVAGEPASASDETYPPNNWAEQEQASMPHRATKLRRIAAVALILAVLVGGVYAGFVATHTFTYPSSSAPIVNKPLTITFTANVLTPVRAICAPDPCGFHVFGTVGTPVIVMASSALLTGTGVTFTQIQAAPLTTPCSATPPTSGTGVVTIPLPGDPAASTTFSAETDYAYCVYYTSGTSILNGSFQINYQA